MFAVKGWSVDAAALKPQTEIFKSSRSGHGEPDGPSKKRKRTHALEAKQDPNVRPDDIGRLWKQHVEGDGTSKSQSRKERKKRKKDQMNRDEDALSEHPHEKGQQKSGAMREKVKMPESERKKKKKHILKDETSEENSGAIGGTGQKEHKAIPTPPTQPVPPTLTPMQSAMRQKLISARFRHLNQTLYTEPSSKAQALFDQNPEMFEDYHAGFRQQVSVWPENPVDKFVSAIRERGKINATSHMKGKKRNPNLIQPSRDIGRALPRTHGTAIIVDMGCGDARLAQTLTESGDVKILDLKIHSYDLHQKAPYITKADIANLPLQDGSVDVAIFCLALMGTNWISFVEEAYRILHWKGELWIAEIKSRFGRVTKAGKPVEHSVGGKRKQAAARKDQEAKAKEQEDVNEQQVLQTEVDGVPKNEMETDVSAFVEVLKRRGFVIKPPTEEHVDLRNKMFVKLEFVKALAPIKGKGKDAAIGRASNEAKAKTFIEEDADIDSDEEARVLKPCLYKVR